MLQIDRVVLLLGGLVLAASVGVASEKPSRLPAGAGRLTVTEQVTPGTNYCTVEFVRGDTLVRTKMTNSYNIPTNDSSYSGDLLPVYLVVTRRVPARPAPMQSVQVFIKALEAAGYEVSADGEDSAGGEAFAPKVRTYTVVPAAKRDTVPPPVPVVPK